MSEEAIKREFETQEASVEEEQPTEVETEKKESEITFLDDKAEEPVDEEAEPEEDKEEEEKPKTYQDSEDEKEKARKSGWTDFDEYVEKGGDPKNWKTARHFNEYGDLVGKLNQTKRDFESRLENVNTLHKMQMRQLETQSQQLQEQYKEAVETGDWDAVQRVQNQISQNSNDQYQLKQQQQQALQQEVQGRQQVLDDWNQRNPWVMDSANPQSPNHQKAVYAVQRYQQLEQAGVPVDQALQAIEQEVTKAFPDSNPNRDKAAVTDSKPGNRGGSEKISMSDLTPQEQQQWNQFGDMFKSKQDFLKAVADSRKGAKK